MDGLIFLLIWIGGAAIHTAIELRWRVAEGESFIKMKQRVERERYESDSCQ